jgi:hypothetical protein
MFTPVVRPAIVQTILALATTSNWTIKQFDVKNAFFHGDLKEDVYVLQPQGFIHPEFLDHVFKLNKALYELKQATCAWFEKFIDFLF